MTGAEMFHCLQVRRAEGESGALTVYRTTATQWARSPRSWGQLDR